MHIGILQCGHAPEDVIARHGDYDGLFATLFDGQGLTFSTWDVVDMDFPPGLEAAEGWLVTGSKHGAYEDHAFIPPLEDFIRAAHAARAPMVGICFGHQIIAQALGGRVEKFAGGWAVGRRTYTLDGMGEVALNAWHQDQVLEVPPEARVLGGNAFCANAALAYGRQIFTIQPHPEISTPVLGTYLEVRGDDPIYEPAMIEEARATMALPTHDALLAAHMARFLKEARP
ncbi:MAG: type 1 glutamine amidotransferase [Pseudomonadota bacterium]